MGRNKKDTKPFPVRAYKETIKEIRKQAVIINRQYEENLTNKTKKSC